MVLLELELDPQKFNFFLGKMDELLKFHFHLIPLEVVADKNSMVKTVNHVLLEVLFQGRLSASDQR
jgi:hypothetical protein